MDMSQPAHPPTFSIITVVLNGVRHLKTAIESVQDQDCRHIEHIVIDGGSVDGSVDVISSYSDRLEYWVSEPDTDIYAAMNKGWQRARGTWVGFLNADDYYVESALSNVMQLVSKKDCDVVYGNMMVQETHEHEATRTLVPDLEQMDRNMGVFHPACFVKKQVLEELGGFDESYRISGDYDLMLRALMSNYSFQYIDRSLTVFRPGGVSSSWKAYLEGYKIQRRYNLPAKNRMLLSMVKKWLSEKRQHGRVLWNSHARIKSR